MDFINQYKIPIIIGGVVVILIIIYNTMLKKRNKVKIIIPLKYTLNKNNFML